MQKYPWWRWVVELGGLATAIAVSSCRPPPAPPPTSITIFARAETGAAVQNAEIYTGTSFLARTDPQGRAELDVNGTEGDTFELRVKCPQGYLSPSDPVVVRRLTIASTGAGPEYSVTCHETRHTLVVAVRAEGGPDLPILQLGKEVARTDRWGAAHMAVKMDVHERLELMLATAGKEYANIHPQNPVAIFEMPDHDDIQVFSVTFTRDRKRVFSAPAPHGPRQF
jgi:hypothetical protein